MSSTAKHPDQSAGAPHSCFIAETDYEGTRDLFTAATTLAASGLGTPLALPRGKKYPPPRACTGRFSGPSLADAVAAVANYDGNLALRLADNVVVGDEPFEVIGIDVDAYEDKTGDKTYNEISAATPLPPTWRSTRRGGENPSGIRLYLAPAGLKWPNQAGPDIEIIRHGHRYAAVSPSIVDGMHYEWFDADDNPSGPPRAVELPVLPIEFVEQLTVGRRAEQKNQPTKPIEVGQGEQWLAEFIPFFNDPMSDHLAADVLDPAQLASEMSNGSHDAATSKTHHVIQLAVEGHHGLGKALAAIEDALHAEHAQRHDAGQAYRSLEALSGEWRRIIDGAVDTLRGDLDAGLAVLLETGGHAAGDAAVETSAVAATITATAHAAADAGDEVTERDATQYPDNDTGRAHLLLDMMKHRLVAISDVDETFAVFLAGRWSIATAGQIHANLWGQTVTASLEATAGRLFAEADAADEAGDADAAAEIRKAAKVMIGRAVKSGDESAMARGTRHAWKACANRRSLASFDTGRVAFGARNGVIDVEAYAATRDLGDLLRPSRSTDAITRDIGFDFDPRATSLHLDGYLDRFVPNLELRRDLFRVLGSMIELGNRRRHFVSVVGGTSTGKSTLLHWLTSALGSVSTTQLSGEVAGRPGYVGAGSVDLFSGTTGPDPALLAAVFSRILTIAETNSRQVFHGDTFKKLTGGDVVQSRKLYSNNMVQAIPHFTPILVTNQLPTISGADEAVFRRLIVVPFETAHRGSIDRAEFTDADKSAFLMMLIDGYVDGIDRPWMEASDLCAEIAGASLAARGELDPVGAWIDETFVEDASATVTQRVGPNQAWTAWTAHVWSEGIEIRDQPTMREFHRKMTEAFGPTDSRKLADGSRKRVYVRPVVLRDVVADVPRDAGRVLKIRRGGR